MRSVVLSFATAFVLGTVALPVSAAEPSKAPAAASATCEHGVTKALCTRCNPKLAPEFKKKGDWCPEHDRPESQCWLCHPDLKAKGVKE